MSKHIIYYVRGYMFRLYKVINRPYTYMFRPYKDQNM